MKQEIRNFLTNLSNCCGIVQRNSSKLGNELINIFRNASIGTTVKHEQQCFIRYKDTRQNRVSFRYDKTRTTNVLNCFKNDRSSKFIGEVIFKKYVV